MRAPRTARALLRADDGFTLGEVLVTVLLVGLLTLAVAAGIGVAVKAYGSIKQATEANALMGNAVTAVQDELRFAYDVEAVSGASSGVGPAYAFDSSVRGYRLYLANGTDSITGRDTIIVNGVNAVNPEGTADPLPGTVDTVAALPLLNTDTSGTGASVQLESLTWNPDPVGGGLWAFSLTVSNGDYEAQSKTITVRTVNNW